MFYFDISDTHSYFPSNVILIIIRSYLRPVHWFIKEGASTSFYQVSYIAKAKGQLAFGYKLANGELYINPRDKNKPIEWADGDVLLIIALD